MKSALVVICLLIIFHILDDVWNPTTNFRLFFLQKVSPTMFEFWISSTTNHVYIYIYIYIQLFIHMYIPLLPVNPPLYGSDPSKQGCLGFQVSPGCVYVYVYVHMYICIYIYIHTYISWLYEYTCLYTWITYRNK